MLSFSKRAPRIERYAISQHAPQLALESCLSRSLILVLVQ
jgi:hypothetical protein